MNDKIPKPGPVGARSATVLVLTVLAPFGLGYYMSYLFRTVNAIISPQLVRDIGLTPADLGLMTSAYFVTFAAAQLPLGIVLDRYGPRRVQSALMFVAAIGAALFAFGTDAVTMVIGRAVVGLGVSGCLMAALKANVMWFPREKIPVVNGLTFAFGTAGALSSTVPLELLIQVADWRSVFWGLAVVSILSGLLIWFAVPQRTPEARAATPGRSGFRSQLDDLRQVYGSAFFWRVSMIIVLHNGVFLSYQSLWAAPWLRDVAGLDRSGVADAMFLFNGGMLVGVLSIGVLAERLMRVGIPPVVLAGGGIGLSIAIQILLALQWTAYPGLLCFLFGFFGSSSVLAYAVLNQHFPTTLTGRVNTAQNMLTFICAFATQWLAGAIIGLYPAGPGGHYSTAGHQAALSTCIALEVAGYLYFLWYSRSLARK